MSWEQLSVHRGCRVLGSLLGNSHRDPALFQHFQRMWSRRLWSTYIIILPPVKYPKQSLYKHAKLRLFTAQAERENYTRCIVPTQILFCRNIASMIRRDSQTGGTLSHSRGGGFTVLLKFVHSKCNICTFYCTKLTLLVAIDYFLEYSPRKCSWSSSGLHYRHLDRTLTLW